MQSDEDYHITKHLEPRIDLFIDSGDGLLVHLAHGGLQVQKRHAHEQHNDHVGNQEDPSTIFIDEVGESPETSVADTEPHDSQHIVEVAIVELSLVSDVVLLFDLERLELVEEVLGMVV